MNETRVEIETKDGLATGHFFHPPGEDRGPAILLFMDAVGVRPDLLRMGERLASHGYSVLLPDLYYRSMPYAPLDVSTAFTAGPERERRMALMRSIDNRLVMRDTAAFLEFIDRQPRVSGKEIGCVGYCMGGQFALAAAGTFPDRLAAAASIHGAHLATERLDSPHRLADKMRARIYVGVAETDAGFPPEERDRLRAAFEKAGVDHVIEVYPGVRHGFAVTDNPAYDHDAAELHWARLLELFSGAMSITK